VKLAKVRLQQFRSYRDRIWSFTYPTTILVGPNAVGKTNILEAIFLLATGESFRAGKIEEMVSWGEEVAHISGQVAVGSEQQVQLQVTLTRGMVQGKKVQKRLYKVNDVGRRRSDFVGNLAVVLFRPEDVDIVTGSPGRRRTFLDQILIQGDREYRRSFMSYEKALRRRNKLLTLIREGQMQRTVLTFWSQLLIKEGNVITTKRQQLVEFINRQADIEVRRQIVYDWSYISEARLAQYEQEEVAAGYTLVGPHRDDFKIVSSGQETADSRDLAIYGSRGEQRMAVIWLKLAELAFLTEKLGERPLLLLDDIFSELDNTHDQLVIDLLGKQQTILTTTEVDDRFNKMVGVEVRNLENE
jgi:DNA replication and repair protein RecF